MNSDRLYAVRLLWVHDSERFTEYQEKAKPTPAGKHFRIGPPRHVKRGFRFLVTIFAVLATRHFGFWLR